MTTLESEREEAVKKSKEIRDAPYKGLVNYALEMDELAVPAWNDHIVNFIAELRAELDALESSLDRPQEMWGEARLSAARMVAVLRLLDRNKLRIDP